VSDWIQYHQDMFQCWTAFSCIQMGNFPTCTRNGHRHRVTYTTGCIDTIDSPDDEHGVARNM